MATFKIYQGDSYNIPVSLKQAGYSLTPDLVSDIRVTVGESLSYDISSGKLHFDEDEQMWYFRPTQSETLSLEPDSYSVMAKVKYRNNPADVISVLVGTLVVVDATDTEEI